MFVVGLVLMFYFAGAVLVKINNRMVDSEMRKKEAQVIRKISK